jgi:hypothetical protein
MEHIKEAALEALASELRRQGHDFVRSSQPPFVGPCDIPSAVYVTGCINLEAMAAAVLSVSMDQKVPA